MSSSRDKLDRFRSGSAGLDAESLVARAVAFFGPDRLLLASSFSLEDQVLTDMLVRAERSAARVFTLDTGRLFPETHETLDRSMRFFGIHYEVAVPDATELSALVGEHGSNLFFESVEKRHLCCDVRKVRPLRRILATADAWITGLRREQASTRSAAEPVERDEANGLVKINPLFDWTEGRVRARVRERGLPYNILHDRGYPSIGCAPCTRAVAPGEDPRAGRWWWERPEGRECGLHAGRGKGSTT